MPGDLDPELRELLLQGLETEEGGVELYEEAVECAIDGELKQEWQKYLAQTKRHVEVMHEVCAAFQLDPEEGSPGREVVHLIGQTLVQAVQKARASGNATAAQRVAAECVVLAETKDHLDWELLGAVAKRARGNARQVLTRACEEVEDQEDEHLYHTQGWVRELWLDALGIPAELPPPEEVEDVKSAMGAARAKSRRKEVL